MSISLATSADNNDLYLDASGNLALVRDIDAVLQDCEHAMKMVLGEAIYDQEKGIPYMQVVFNNYNATAFEGYARQNLQAVSGVVQVQKFGASVTGNVLDYEATIATIYGSGVING